MVRIYGLFSVLMFAFVLYCILDVVLTDSSLIRNLPKVTWVFLIIFLPLIGGIAWLVGGRAERATMAPGGARSRPSSPPRRAGAGPVSRPRGPDDDPAFLESLAERMSDDADRHVGDGQVDDGDREDEER